MSTAAIQRGHRTNKQTKFRLTLDTHGWKAVLSTKGAGSTKPSHFNVAFAQNSKWLRSSVETAIMSNLNKKDVAESAVELSMSDGVSIADEAEYGDRMEDQRPRTSGLFKTIVNVVNTIIGSGILGLPVAVSEIGWALGIVVCELANRGRRLCIVADAQPHHVGWRVMVQWGREVQPMISRHLSCEPL